MDKYRSGMSVYSKPNSRLVLASTFIFLFVYEAITWTRKTQSADMFSFLLYLSMASLCLVFYNTRLRAEYPFAFVVFYSLFLAINVVALLRGILLSDDYYDWKNIFVNIYGGFSLIIPLAVVVGSRISNVSYLLKWLFFAIVLSFGLIPLILGDAVRREAFSRLNAFLPFIVLVTPLLKKRYRLFIFTVCCISVFLAIGWRTNVVRILGAYMVISTLLFSRYVRTVIYSSICISMLAVPLVLFYLGLEGDNIFERNAKQEIIMETDNENENYMGDTRTMLYAEVLKDLVTDNALVLGKGVNAKYKSEYFTEGMLFKGRGNVEVGFLKMLMHSGVLGMLVYSIMLFVCVYYGLFYSSNFLTKVSATYLAFHWMLLFVENIPAYNIYTYFSWVFIGLCASNRVRGMTDDEIRRLFRFQHA